MNTAVVTAVVVLLSASATSHAAAGGSEKSDYLTAALSVAGLQALFIGGLLVQRSRQRRAELALQESETLHRVTLGSISDAVFITTSNGDFTFVCPNVDVIFGYTQAETEQLGSIHCLLGHTIPDATTLQAPGEVGNHECTILDKRGHTHQLLVSVKPVSIKGGTMLYACRDVTDRRRAEDASRQLAHAHRLAGMGALTAMIAHEVNQPLGAILANAEAAEMLLEQPEPPLAEIREILEDIRRSDLRADEAIRHMRTLLRRQELQIEPVDLNPVVTEVAHLVAGDAASRRIRIRTTKASPLPLAAGDPVHLQHVLLNVVINAMDAMAKMPPGRREVVIRTRRTAAGEARVSVTDRGAGIPADKLSSVFEAFYTTKRNGMGLGLSISRSIIKAHRGRIWAENNRSGGATFHFTVPLADAEAAIAGT